MVIALHKYIKITLWDVLLLGTVYLLPTFSHLLGVPLYLIDPMRIMVLGSVLLLKNKMNAYLLAFTLPLFSFLVSGHPIFLKNFLISIELGVNVFLFFTFFHKIRIIFPSIFLSIIGSKLIYYILKYFMIVIGLLHTNIISTSLWIQWSVVLSISIIFSLFYKKS